MATKSGVLYRIVELKVALPMDIEMGPFCSYVNQMFRPAEADNGGPVSDWRLGLWDEAPLHVRDADGPSDIFIPANSVKSRVDDLVVSHPPEVEESLDGSVRDMKEQEASAINNGGLCEQVEFLRASGVDDISILRKMTGND